jgi:1-aminocyclopropane-1-carboxylate deaminase
MRQVSSDNNSDIDKIKSAPRIALGKWPTPLTFLKEGQPLMIKRDDLSGFGRGGIKTRKLEFLFGDYVQRGIRDFVAVVPNISNLRADIECLASALEIRTHLIIANDPPLKKRQYADSEFVKYTLAGRSMFSTAFQLLKQYVQLRIGSRKRTALLLPGAAHPASVIGASTGLIELYKQCRSEGFVMPRDIFISASSGASAAGLVLASLLLREQHQANIRIHVIRVFPIPMKFWIVFLLYWTKKRYRLRVKIKDLPCHIIKSGLPYGRISEELKTLCNDLKESYNVRVDHIYGAQTWKGMKVYLDERGQEEGSVFWHCGFTPDAASVAHGI